MSEYFADISWSTLANNVQLSNQPYRYIFTVNPLDPNEPGAGNMQMSVGDWFIDFSGYPFLIENINGTTITVYDINERGNSNTSAYGPYNGQIGYIYRPKYNAFLLTQAQLRKLDKSAPDVIQNMEKIVLWKYRGVKLEDGTNVLDNTTEIVLENLELTDLNNEGWQGGKKVKIKALSSGGNSYLEVTQTNHGFDGHFVFFNGTIWEKAIANNENKCATHFAVKIDNNIFKAYSYGDIDITITDDTDLALVNGEYYFLSQTVAGKVNRNKPTSGIIQSVLYKTYGSKINISIQEPYEYVESNGGGGNVSPGGNNMQIQFNDSGVFGGTPFYYDKILDTFSVNNLPSYDSIFSIYPSQYWDYVSSCLFSVTNNGMSPINNYFKIWGDYTELNYLFNTEGSKGLEISTINRSSSGQPYDTGLYLKSRLYSITGYQFYIINDDDISSKLTFGSETYQESFALYYFFKNNIIPNEYNYLLYINTNYEESNIVFIGHDYINGFIGILIRSGSYIYSNSYRVVLSYRNNDGSPKTYKDLVIIPERIEYNDINVLCESLSNSTCKIKIINTGTNNIDLKASMLLNRFNFNSLEENW